MGTEKAGLALGEEMPTMHCPRCGAEHPDFDGLGMVAHTKPAFPDGCGYCTHPSRDGTYKDGALHWACGICGDVVVSPLAGTDTKEQEPK